MTIAGSMRNEIARFGTAGYPIGKVRTMEMITAESVAQPRFRTLLLGLFGIAALLLASSGFTRDVLRGHPTHA